MRFHQSSHAARGRGSERALIERSICFADRIEKKTERRRDIEIVIERLFELFRWTLNVGPARNAVA